MTDRITNTVTIGWLRLLATGSIALLTSCSAPEPTDSEPLSVNAFLQSDNIAGFQKALEPLALQFPRDHGPHPAYKNEWWYITGNLKARDDRQFGYQFTLFRNALDRRSDNRASHWATSQVYLAHVAITDVAENRFYTDERFSRGTLGLAGVRQEPFKAWLDDWIVEEEPIPDCDNCFAIRVRTKNRAFSLDLSLSTTKPVVLHGDGGLSQKSETLGNASYYYSYTRLRTKGELRVGDQSHVVGGNSWLDHEWSTSALEKDQAGWDWFSIQLSNNTELMLFQLRHVRDPGKHYRRGTYVDAQGAPHQLSGSEFEVNAVDTWSSPDTGVTYPSGWRIRVPSLDLVLSLKPVIHSQELNQSFRYWEGAVKVTGDDPSRGLSGQGYAELTGYN